MLRKDHTSLASSLSVLTIEVAALKTEKAVDVVRDENLNGRLNRIEENLKDLRGIGRWALIAFFGAIITTGVGMMMKGGFHVPPSV
ncbi:hypothetical protein [Aureimonas sp. Leaf454]|uniref:hypothetical protein n=1 Tax=Aureimonas sp. Leaf454 TaxID=1736381 RepID=UPI0012E3A588|nr:hypothetical protein [Aureimonas sp. Leaf454]